MDKAAYVEYDIELVTSGEDMFPARSNTQTTFPMAQCIC